jgi:hypothetical protein
MKHEHPVSNMFGTCSEMKEMKNMYQLVEAVFDVWVVPLST